MKVSHGIPLDLDVDCSELVVQMASRRQMKHVRTLVLRPRRWPARYRDRYACILRGHRHRGMIY